MPASESLKLKVSESLGVTLFMKTHGLAGGSNHSR